MSNVSASKRDMDQVMQAWGSVVDYVIVNAFKDHVNAYEVVNSPWPVFFNM